MLNCWKVTSIWINSKMRIALYSPYLDTAGGGEKYILTIGEILAKKEKVDFLIGTHLYFLDIEKIKNKIQTLHNLDLSNISFIKSPVGKGSNFLSRIFFLKKYDCLFYLTDGSIFFSSAKKSFLHFQSPIPNTSNSFWQQFKLKSYSYAIYNSYFTKQIIEKTWDIKGQVIYPPVPIEDIKPLLKKRQILSVGRFFGYLKNKKHSLLIKIFKELVDGNLLNNWSLHLVGSAGDGDDIYLEELREETKGYDIFLHPNATFEEIKKLYGQSSIYWHAMGFGEEDPQKFEHFGIATVEAMAAGVVPVVIKKGGQLEIVRDGKNGFLWENLDQLKYITVKLTKESKLIANLAKAAIKDSTKFSKEEFIKKIHFLLKINV